jgi:hypothetical protein
VNILLLVWSERLLGFAILLQTIELLRMKSSWADTGVWRWSQIRNDYNQAPTSIRRMLDFFLSEENFHRLLKLRLACSLLIWFFHPVWVVVILFFSTWLIAIRWRGIFNGGSDSMTALIALALLVAEAAHSSPLIVKACFAYIAIQLTASYFLAGLAKVKNREWRAGLALPLFFETPRYNSPPKWVRAIADNKRAASAISWMVILFELSFPLAWLNSNFCSIYLAAAFVFHLANFYVFGLNRFVFAWIAAYPALYSWSLRR